MCFHKAFNYYHRGFCKDLGSKKTGWKGSTTLWEHWLEVITGGIDNLIFDPINRVEIELAGFKLRSIQLQCWGSIYKCSFFTYFSLTTAVPSSVITYLWTSRATVYYAQLYLLSYLYLCRTSKLLVWPVGGWLTITLIAWVGWVGLSLATRSDQFQMNWLFLSGWVIGGIGVGGWVIGGIDVENKKIANSAFNFQLSWSWNSYWKSALKTLRLLSITRLSFEVFSLESP